MPLPPAQPSPPAPHGADATTAPPAHSPGPPAGAFVTLEGEDYYRIAGVDRMPPFLMTLASDCDLWMFVTSKGGLTAGRVDADGAIFPYETVDKLLDGHHHTGPITLLRVRAGTGEERLWEPFAAADPAEGVERNLYKNVAGNRLVCEEIHHGLGLAFRARWSGCDEFGHVRTVTLANLGDEPVAVSLLDGLRNVLPYGAPLALYQQSSCLVDAYKQSECDPATKLGVFALTTRILDRPEASEILRANAAWCHGLPGFEVALSIDAVAAFRRGETVRRQDVLTGSRGNYLVHATLELAAGARARWHVVADAARSQAQLVALRARLRADAELGPAIDMALDAAGANLRRLVASADGEQLGGRAEDAAHHFANVLFNVMRGGIFERGYDVPVADWTDFLRVRQPRVALRHAALFESWPATISLADLLAAAEKTGDADFERLAHEYLPIWFGRRHGDPSRPWNRFRIHVAKDDGTRALQYEGNWRDIFQNWEALALSFPGFLPSMIAKFVNASTVDGFNPYRIARNGIDWEVEEPGSPWSNIGYWGDHQVIYLLKLLEWMERFSPGTLARLLEREIFSYADVPYRLRGYARMIETPRATIQYDRALAARIAARVAAMGADGKLLVDAAGAVVHVSLLEKLLVPILSKLSNLVPDGGIWMNTQRPEWNDANNALVGPGVSVVTLGALRRHLTFLEPRLRELGGRSVPVSAEVVRWLRGVHAAFASHPTARGDDAAGERERKRFLDEVGEAFSAYREAVYAHGPGDKEPLPIGDVAALCRVALQHVDDALRANRRADGLYHSYNLIHLSADRQRLSLRRLDTMLEGQVAALSSGLVGPEEAARMLDQLFASALYRADQRSFLLYPDRRVAGFLARNMIPAARVHAVPLLERMLAAGETSLVIRDRDGACRFQADLANAADVEAALARLAAREAWRPTVDAGRAAVLDVFEEVFGHGVFTGRSSTMYGYEGLGSIYWHMVSKLLLAAQEVAWKAWDEGCAPDVRDALARSYFRVRAGLGFEKSPAEYGAFPTDPYSHTPAHAGAQQPGMTGMVKEEILTRLGELGLVVADGEVSFRPVLLRDQDFLRAAATYRSYAVDGRALSIAVPAGSLAFSFCQVPIVYARTDAEAWIRVSSHAAPAETRPGNRLGAAVSQAVFARRGTIARIDVGVPASALFRG